MNLKILNIILASIVVISNLYLLPLNISIINENGGAMGIGWIISPFLTICNLFIIPAIFTLFKNIRDNRLLLFLNILGVISCGFIAFLAISTPKMD